MQISPNLLKALLCRVYFVTGTAYAGKSTLVRTLARLYGGVHCGENYHDALMHLIDREHQPNLSYFDTMSSWQEFVSRTPEAYAAWIDGVGREAAELELLLLIKYAQENKPVFVDTNIPPEMLHEIAPEGHVLVMLSPQSLSVERFFDRSDPEKQFLLEQLRQCPDPEAAMENYRACLARINSPEVYAALEHSGFPVWVRQDDSTPEDALRFAEGVFQLQRPAWRIEKERLVARYREENRSALPHQTVFAGSSLMEQFPVHLWAAELGPAAPRVYNRGVGGYRTEDMLPILDALVTDLQPRRLFINIGTNDLSDPEVTIPALMGRYDEILSRIEQAVPDLGIVLMAYYPINRDAARDDGMRRTLSVRTNERIRQANGAVRLLAEKHGAKYLDVNAPITDEQGRLRAEYTTEGMHLTEAGYRALWPLVAQAILAE